MLLRMVALCGMSVEKMAKKCICGMNRVNPRIKTQASFGDSLNRAMAVTEYKMPEAVCISL